MSLTPEALRTSSSILKKIADDLHWDQADLGHDNSHAINFLQAAADNLWKTAALLKYAQKIEDKEANLNELL